MRRAVAALFALCCLLSAAGGATAATGFGAFQTGGVTADTVVLRADIQPDGDAVWTIEYRVRLDDENATEAFRSLQSDIRANTSAYTDQFARRMHATVAAAENATGREMAVSEVGVSTEVRQLPSRYGVVTYRFVWEGFAATPGRRLVIGDALSGFFLDERSRLVVSWPDGYEVRSVAPDPTSRTETSVTWQGPADFGGDEPRLVLAPAGVLPVSLPALAVLLLVVLGVGAGVWRWRRHGREETPASTEPGAEERTGPTETPEPGPEETGDEAGETGETTGGGGSEEAPEELLSPEERVLRLLRERGGRMKQKEVTEELDWSAARTSQVVGDLRDAGEVESFRLGRENVLKLPEEDEEL